MRLEAAAYLTSFGARAMKSVISVSLVLVAVFVGCTQPKPPAQAPSTNNGKTASLNLTNFQAYMVPLEEARNDPPEKAIPWNQLFRKIANDHESQLLANRLWWDAPVEFIVADNADEVGGKADNKKEEEALAAGPSLVRIRICSEASPTGSTDHLSVGLWNYRRLSHRVVAETHTYNSMSEAMVQENSSEDSDDFEFLMLLCNDYLLRHNAGWIVVDGRGVSPGSVTSPRLDATQAQADLDHRLENYLKKFDSSAERSAP